MAQYMDTDDITEKYINKLSAQKLVYEHILDLSEKERAVLKSKPLVMHKVLEFLKAKEDHLNQIYELEQEIVPLRDIINTLHIDPRIRFRIKTYLHDIASILENLLNIDAGNELMLQENLKQSSQPKITRQHAAKAYAAFGK